MKTIDIFYRNYTIEIWSDDDRRNPFIEDDGNCPLMYISNHNFKDYSNGEIFAYLSKKPTDGQIIRYQKQIADIFIDIDLQNMEQLEFSKTEKIDEIRYYISKGITDFNQLAEFCKLFKITYLNTISRGYSQGDYAELFICETPEFYEITGCEKLTEEMMQDSANLWNAFAWGDVYGYTIKETDDSVGGFYGSEHDKSGLLDNAKGDIDYIIAKTEKERCAKLKQLIKARVPILYRQQILYNSGLI